jgi:hypothetical protein
MLHIEVENPEGACGRVHGRSEAGKDGGIRFDCVHVAVNDLSRLAELKMPPVHRELPGADGGITHRR